MGFHVLNVKELQSMSPSFSAPQDLGLDIFSIFHTDAYQRKGSVIIFLKKVSPFLKSSNEPFLEISI